MRREILMPLAIFLIALGCVPIEKDDQDTSNTISSNVEILEEAFHVYVIGDWGRNGQFNQQEVADQMSLLATVIEPEFIISTGDNFYPNGIASVNDPQWLSSFENVYKGHLLNCPWYVVLGNHDYRGNVQAEIDYTNISRRWNMPARYFTQRVIEDELTMRFTFIDTSPFELKYYQEEKYKASVSSQDTTKQIQWIDSVSHAGSQDWNIMIGHHPLHSGGKRIDETEDIRRQLAPILERNKVDLYLAGHEHDLQHIKPPGQTHHIISGAGSEGRPSGKMEYSLFGESIPGFVILSITKSDILAQFINSKGAVVYKTKIVR